MEEKENTKQNRKEKPDSSADTNGYGEQQGAIMAHLERSTAPWGSGTIALHHVTFCASN